MTQEVFRGGQGARSSTCFSAWMALAVLPLGVVAVGGVAGCGADETAAMAVAGGGAGGADAGAVGAAGGSGGTGAAGAAAGAGGAPLGPPYPIVLAHGFFGFEDFAGADFINYFCGVKDFLAVEGESEVFTPAVDPFNYSEYRGAQLAEHVRQILIQTGRAKVNLIGHSQGGLDARVVAHDHPEWVASVVTVATPHRGSVIADIALGLVVDPHLDAVLDFFVKSTGQSIWDGAGNETALAASAHQLSTAEAAAFNELYPDAAGVPYWSIGGRSNLHVGGLPCAADMPAFISAWTSTLDPIDPMMVTTGAILSGTELVPAPNDGLVTVESAQWASFLGCVPADHFDEMGQILGDEPGLGNEWDHRQFYADLIAWLRARGL